MEEKRLTWIEDDQFGTKHSVTEGWAIKTLKALYDRWPCGLEEMEASTETLKRLLNEAREDISILRNSCATAFESGQRYERLKIEENK